MSLLFVARTAAVTGCVDRRELSRCVCPWRVCSETRSSPECLSVRETEPAHSDVVLPRTRRVDTRPPAAVSARHWTLSAVDVLLAAAAAAGGADDDDDELDAGACYVFLLSLSMHRQPSNYCLTKHAPDVLFLVYSQYATLVLGYFVCNLFKHRRKFNVSYAFKVFFKVNALFIFFHFRLPFDTILIGNVIFSIVSATIVKISNFGNWSTFTRIHSELLLTCAETQSQTLS